MWIIQDRDISDASLCAKDALAIVHKSFKDIMIDVEKSISHYHQYDHTYKSLDYFDNQCLPESVLVWAKKMKQLRDEISQFKTKKKEDTVLERVLIE